VVERPRGDFPAGAVLDEKLVTVAVPADARRQFLVGPAAKDIEARVSVFFRP